MEIAASTLWGGEDFSWPSANFLETWGRDGFFFSELSVVGVFWFSVRECSKVF